MCTLELSSASEKLDPPALNKNVVFSMKTKKIMWKQTAFKIFANFKNFLKKNQVKELFDFPDLPPLPLPKGLDLENVLTCIFSRVELFWIVLSFKLASTRCHLIATVLTGLFYVIRSWQVGWHCNLLKKKFEILNLT